MTDPLSPSQIAELRYRCEGVGLPWTLTIDHHSWEDQTGERYAQIDWALTPSGADSDDPYGWALAGVDDRDLEETRAHVEFVAAAINLIPALLATVEAQAAVISRYRNDWMPWPRGESVYVGWWVEADDVVLPKDLADRDREPMSPAEQVVVYGEVIKDEERSDV